MEEYRRLREKNVPTENKILSLFTAVHFSCIGHVNNVYKDGKRIDVILPYRNLSEEDVILRGIEVLQSGNKHIGITYTPEKGDTVLVFATQNYYPVSKSDDTVKSNKDCPYYKLYGDTNLKALLVRANTEEKQDVILKLEKDKLTLKSKIDISIETDASNVEIKADKANIKIKAKSFNINNGNLEVT
jgi:hypothetical protein